MARPLLHSFRFYACCNAKFWSNMFVRQHDKSVWIAMSAHEAQKSNWILLKLFITWYTKHERLKCPWSDDNYSFAVYKRGSRWAFGAIITLKPRKVTSFKNGKLLQMPVLLPNIAEIVPPTLTSWMRSWLFMFLHILDMPTVRGSSSSENRSDRINDVHADYGFNTVQQNTIF